MRGLERASDSLEWTTGWATREVPQASAARRLSSAALFGGHEEIVIVHRSQEYRLRITRADKLILTK